MFQNYLRVMLRNLLRNKFYSLLNIAGLSVGIACAILILLFIRHEQSYENFYDNTERIFRLNARYEIGGRVDEYANVPRPLGPTFAKDFPEVQNYARVLKHNRYTGNPVLIQNREMPEKTVSEDLVFAADSGFFQIFSHSFLHGNPQTALSAPNTAVITENVAQKLFGDANPLNREIVLDNQEKFHITGVIKDVPENTHLRFQVLLSWQTFHSERDLQRWIGGHVYTYLLFGENPDMPAFMAKWPDFYQKYMATTFASINGKFDLMIQPLKDIHLHSHLQWEATENGDITYVYIFAAVGIFILLIACINYMNMATARAATRLGEVGMRKVLGAQRSSLMKQFFGEALLMAFLAFIVALLFVKLLLPITNELSGKNLIFDFTNPLILFSLLTIVLVTGILSGIYPALYLSGFQPIRLLKGGKSATRAPLRKALVIVQFAISIIIIIATGVVNKQLEYARQKNLGFNKENVLVITLKDKEMEKQLPVIKTELLAHPNILKAATSPDIPGKDLNHTAVQIETPEGTMEDQTVQFMYFDHDFIDLMEMGIEKGRNFERSKVTDKDKAILINQTLARKFQWENPVGKRIRFAGDTTDIYVAGVVNDFHAGSFHHEIAPIIMLLSPQENGRLYLRLRNQDIDKTLRFIEEKWAGFNAAFPLDYVFLDQNFYKLYTSDKKLATIFGYFSWIAIIISCLGLLGLSAYTIAQRTKEIGIRKVLGATAANVVVLLSKDFMALVLLANVVAWPVAYFAMQHWLESFAYHTQMGVGIFVFSAVAAVVIALFTIAFLAFKAAFINPAESLRYE